MMTYVNFKTALIAILMATSSFASSVPSEEDERARSTLVHVPMRAGDFNALPSDAMGYLVSCMPVYKLEEAQNFVLVCKYFHTHVVPRMRLSWKPKGGSIPTDGSFAQRSAPRIVILNLANNTTFTNDHLKGFTSLKDLDLDFNETITDEGLQGLTNLTHLDLTLNEIITDAAVKKLPKLMSLMLIANTSITSKGYAHLPNLEIFR
jgi:Leucine-rich repeat (LRR) protein